MKRAFLLFIAMLMLLCGCDLKKDIYRRDAAFIESKEGHIASKDGVEYVFVAYEGILDYFGEYDDLEFVGGVKGEPKTSCAMMEYQTGMFAIKENQNDNVLIRREPNNEWYSIYRKASLPTLDCSVDHCTRLEFVRGNSYLERDPIHATCGNGLTDKTEIAAFLSEVRAQPTPEEAGLYDLALESEGGGSSMPGASEVVEKPDGSFVYLSQNFVIYGTFAEEPNLVICLPVTSYHGLAYSVEIDGRDYMLPEKWLSKLQGH